MDSASEAASTQHPTPSGQREGSFEQAESTALGDTGSSGWLGGCGGRCGGRRRGWLGGWRVEVGGLIRRRRRNVPPKPIGRRVHPANRPDQPQIGDGPAARLAARHCRETRPSDPPSLGQPSVESPGIGPQFARHLGLPPTARQLAHGLQLELPAEPSSGVLHGPPPQVGKCLRPNSVSTFSGEDRGIPTSKPNKWGTYHIPTPDESVPGVRAATACGP